MQKTDTYVMVVSIVQVPHQDWPIAGEDYRCNSGLWRFGAGG